MNLILLISFIPTRCVEFLNLYFCILYIVVKQKLFFIQQGVPQMQHVQHMQQQHVPVQQVKYGFHNL